ncbi:hypothetical protein N836_09460 [Leptolyngbya sp. Heron Island J]|uniref:DUF6796 family protein n=1 Tax=Leptolyngbya sp. Heron Island J TaxID=1385935 RepID=UPI0003B9818C|nr:DUF6796 family protein [Leptolyngbya sp. Heron Island J]ESA35936.1 hypothetical protein N836_09460 [Leptolyngbya sp. Heron Island J]
MNIDIEPLLFLGWIAFAASLLNMIADWALMGFPIAGRDLELRMIGDKPRKHVEIGIYSGLMTLPPWLGILFPVLYLLQDASRWLQVLVLMGILLFVMFSLVFHISHIFLDIAFRSSVDSVIACSVQEKERLKRITAVVTLVMSLAILAAGIASDVPVWWLISNPFLVLVVLIVVAKFTPSPVGGYFLAGSGSLGFGIFCLSTMLAL